MQIQPTISAGAAASSVAQSGSKDRAAGTSSSADAAGHPASTNIEQVARSQEANADRDAHGAGPTFEFKKSGKKKSDASGEAHLPESLPVRSPEPPSQLDLLG